MNHVGDTRRPFGILDTSVVIDLDGIPARDLPVEGFVTSLTLTELAAGLTVATSPVENAERQRRYRRTVLDYSVLDFDSRCAEAFAAVYAAASAVGRKPRGRRSMDMLIAAVAHDSGLPLYTRNPDDFEGLEDVVTVVGV